MSFENMIGYFLIFVVFIMGFMPLMNDFIIQAQATADSKTATLLGFVIPFIIVAFVVAFFIRMKGEKPFGEW